MEDKKNEVAVSFSEMLMDKLTLSESALPKTLNKERFVQETLSVLNSNPALQKCNRGQLLTGIMRGAYLGLSAVNSEFYLVPFNNTVQFLTSYKGVCKFAKKYSVRPIKDIYAKLVREGDVFEEKITDGHPSIDFKPIPFSEKPVVGAFAVVLFTDGGMLYDTMTTKEINETRNNYSKAKNSPAWQKSWGEMAKKTIIHRLMKVVEVDFETIEARESWDAGIDSNVVKQEKSDEVIDVFAEKPENPLESPTEENVEDAVYTEIPNDFKSPFK